MPSQLTFRNGERKNSNHPATLKMGQGHQNWYKCVKLRGSHCHAGFQRPLLLKAELLNATNKAGYDNHRTVTVDTYH